MRGVRALAIVAVVAGLAAPAASRASVEAAEEALRAGEPQVAARLIREYLRDHPEGARSARVAAMVARTASDPAEAMGRWDEVIALDPTGPLGAEAHWAKGMHQLSLGDAKGAAESFEQSLAFARRNAEEQKGAPAESWEDFGIALGLGYLGIAECASGTRGGRERFEAACRDFERMAQDEDKKSDAEFGLEQIRYVWSKFHSE